MRSQTPAWQAQYPMIEEVIPAGSASLANDGAFLCSGNCEVRFKSTGSVSDFSSITCGGSLNITGTGLTCTQDLRLVKN